LAVDEVSRRTVIAGVQLDEPFALNIGGQATAHAVRVGPDHCGVVSNSCAKSNIKKHIQIR